MTTTFHRRYGEAALNNILPPETQDPLGLAELPGDTAACFAANPYKAEMQKPFQYLAVTDGTVSGHLGIFPVKLRHNGNTDLVYSGSDLMVAEQYRKFGIGISLLQEFFADMADTVFVAHGISTMAAPVYKFLKMSVKRIPIMKMAVRTGAKLRTVAGGRYAILAPVADVLLALHRWLFVRPKASLRGFTIQQLDRVPEEVDAVLSADPHPYAEWHGHEYLQWLLEHPLYKSKAKRRFHGIYKDGRMFGFYLTKETEQEHILAKGPYVVRTGTVLEWGTLDPQLLPEEKVCLHALLSFGGRVHSASLHTNDDKLRAFLSANGKLKEAGYSNWGVKGSLGDTDGHADISNPKNWRIRTAMGDVGLL